ncbi:hypothetical protein M7I_1383 [Glarea lozoyensis 74030]|uniref:Uncharacterized protein n=1 Tax=Glarea lozoyensis (strain ATCC 74030 / MF5533) TaxID=1104152 RepID=H0EFX5_GLAL7|nr:hypothetical protein M7I_1383 [Glarea lozoyensis 74030]
MPEDHVSNGLSMMSESNVYKFGLIDHGRENEFRATDTVVELTSMQFSLGLRHTIPCCKKDSPGASPQPGDLYRERQINFGYDAWDKSGCVVLLCS